MISTITLEITTTGVKSKELTTHASHICISNESDVGTRAFLARHGGENKEFVYVDDPELAKERKIFVLSEGTYIVDESSENGTRLNGKMVTVPAPIEPNDVLTMGKTRIVVKALDLANDCDLSGFPPRYASVRVLDRCESCGQPLPMNGLRLETPCTSCGKTTPTGPAYWSKFLRHADNDIRVCEGGMTVNSRTQVWMKDEAPACSRCSALLPVDGVAVGTDGEIFCPACGNRGETYPAPDWLRAEIPSIRQIYLAKREKGTAAPGDSPLEMTGSEPVALTCPQCHGGLTVTQRSQRTLTCEYCQASIYLPDDMWNKLHPVSEAKTWFVRFQGPSGNVEEGMQKAREDFEEIRQRMALDPPRTAGKRLAGVIGGSIFVLGLLGGVGGAIWAVTSDCRGGHLERPALVGTQARLGDTSFFIDVPPGYEMHEQMGTIHWTDPDRSETGIELAIQVSESYLPESVEKLRQDESGPFQYWEPTRAEQIDGGGYELHSREKAGSSIEVRVHRPIGDDGQTRSLLCIATVTAGSTDLDDVEEIDAYIASICRSMKPAI